MLLLLWASATTVEVGVRRLAGELWSAVAAGAAEVPAGLHTMSHMGLHLCRQAVHRAQPRALWKRS